MLPYGTDSSLKSAMDDFLDPFLSTTSWADANIHESLPWDDAATASQLNGVFSDCLGAFERNPPKSEASIMAPDKIPVPEANEDAQAHSSIFLNPNMRFGVFAQEDQMQHDIQDPIPVHDETQNGELENRFSFRGVVEHGLAAGSFGTGHDCMASNGSEASLYLQSLADSQSSSTFSQLWTTYPSASAMVGQPGLQVLGLHGDLESSLGKASTDQELQRAGSYPRSLFENQALQNSHIPSYTSSLGMNIADNIGIQSNQQSALGDSAKNPPSNVASDPANLGAVNNNSRNIVAKPRTRARRGQATDPHSIAERLRREKIAERMKNLQELVPNSNKTDKASMLDEIIEYVKFLQLQVKVLSMSRLGATGAVVPLITDMQSQGSRNLNLTSATMDPDLSETQESIAFEQEVVKLMESNVTAAMQFLQNKGLCLMPIALASAISARKGSSSAIPPKKPEGIGHSAAPNASGFMMKDKPEEQQHIPNGCNKAAPKEEETEMPSGSARRNLKSRA